jgi:plastocyanin
MRARYLAFLVCAAAGGKVSGTVTVEKDGAEKRDRSGVVVYLEGVAAVPSEERPQIRQREQQFTPRLTVIPRGTTVEFPNEDKIFHNVFSVSAGAKFDLGLYKSGESKSVTFKRAGTVDVYCNIHPNMIAKVKVVDSPYYAVTRADGSFELAGVPPGTYPIVAWHPAGKEQRGEVTVAEGQTATVTLKVVEGKADTTHLRKDGTPYGRYK